MTAEFALLPNPNPTSDERRAEILAAPGFGRYFTDHMAKATWTLDHGWAGQQVSAIAPYTLHPGAAVLHYAQEIFEGLKAYRHADGSVWLFRPEANAARFAQSAERLALPILPEADFVASLVALVRADQAWVPAGTGEDSLYLRPFMFASEAFLGVRPSVVIEYAVIASPAGPYFSGGVTGITLWVTREYTRAAPGGTGAAKCGGNYAGGLAAQLEAQRNGCDQVLYLDADHRALEESGTMNICIVTRDGRLITPRLGTILAGVTRDTILTLAQEHGLRPEEREVEYAELREGARNGDIAEVFAAGTAAVITPIVRFRDADGEFEIGTAQPGETTLAIRNHLLDIQYGRRPDEHGWMVRVC